MLIKIVLTKVGSGSKFLIKIRTILIRDDAQNQIQKMTWIRAGPGWTPQCDEQGRAAGGSGSGCSCKQRIQFKMALTEKPWYCTAQTKTIQDGAFTELVLLLSITHQFKMALIQSYENLNHNAALKIVISICAGQETPFILM